ncbi:MAG: quinone oxidoreductase [Holophagales bacterium]|nr:quinone oxidoreductase [Holophagales bacterium]
MTHAIRIHQTGGPEVLRWEEVEIGPPGPGEVRLRHTAIGLNFIDTYHRSGLYPLPLPAIPGSEGAGVVEEIGAGVSEVKPGDRVAYAGPVGAYAEERLVPAHRLVPLPEDVDDRVAAAAMLKGMTARYLLRRTHRVEAGETILLHSAAGGVGLIAAQWAKSLGATVIGTVSTEAKAALARDAGCDHVVVTSRESFVARVKEITGGAGVRVVYDAVGKDTFEGSLDCLAPLGLMVSFGNASGPVPPISPLLLAQKGSLFLTRPTLMTYTARREDLLATAADLFAVIRSGAVKVRIDATFPLREAAAAHAALEGRRTTGSTVLLP